MSLLHVLFATGLSLGVLSTLVVILIRQIVKLAREQRWNEAYLRHVEDRIRHLDQDLRFEIKNLKDDGK